AGLSVSDILLFDPPDSLPTQLAAALPYVRGSTVMHPRARVGLFWEGSGLDSGGAVSIGVTLLRVGRGGAPDAGAGAGGGVWRRPILVYHTDDRLPPGSPYPKNSVTLEQCAAQLAFLARHGYTSISFLDYLAYRRGERRLPRRVIILTFDDGYRLTRTIALPLMRQYGFGATIFLVTAYVGKTNLWDADEIQEPLLDASDIRDMQETGIEFGSQTATHAHLA